MAKAVPTRPDDAALLLTVPEVAWLTRMSISTVYLKLKSGEIKSKRQGSQRVVLRPVVEAYIEALPDELPEPRYERNPAPKITTRASRAQAKVA